MILATIIATTAAVLILIPSLTLFVECLAAAFVSKRKSTNHERKVTAAILIPAHNEALHISATVARIAIQLRKGDRLVVVADNCSDQTGNLAAKAGGDVVERFHGQCRLTSYGQHRLEVFIRQTAGADGRAIRQDIG